MLRRICGLICTIALLAVPGSPATAQGEGFADSQVITGVSGPTAFAFLPDGSMLVAGKGGRLWLVGPLSPGADPVALAAPGADPPILSLADRLCTESERGLLGLAVDPQFGAGNRFIYLYYTFRRPTADPCSQNVRETDPVNRVSRFTLTADRRVIDELVLVDNIPSPNGNHNAGDLQFGKDGQLYVSVGDGGRDYGGGGAGANDAARDRHTLLGKILRITRDGGIPPGNPFVGAGSGRCYDPAPGGNRSGSTAPGSFCQETYGWGLRNPFRIAFDPNAIGVRFFINDVGQGRAEEISAGQAGADYGWNCFEGTLTNNTGGPCASEPPAGPLPPTFEYRRSPIPAGQDPIFEGCYSITGGAFVPAGVWPTAYDGAYLFADYGCRRIFALLPAGDGYTPALLLSPGRAPTHMAFGPYGDGLALYYADYFGNQIRAVRYTGGANRAPTAALTASPTAGAPPLDVAFDASGSADPDAGDRVVAYEWAFGDGATAETAGPTTGHRYAAEGSYTASVRARDSSGARSAPASLQLSVGNEAPVAQISAPAASERFAVGQQLTLRGSATDPEDGALSGASLRWEVRLRHAEHDHPYAEGEGASLSLRYPAPEDLPAVSSSFLEVRLTATDSLGRSSTVTRELRPQIVDLTFQTQPAGLRVRVDGGTVGNTVVGLTVLPSWPGYQLSLDVPGGQSLGGRAASFCYWAQGGPRAQTLTTPGADALYVAVFALEGAACPSTLPPDGDLWLPVLGSRP